MPDTPHLGLPLIEAAQAQKHVTHNEALVRLDTLVQLAVLSRSLSAPPAAPAEGDRYIVKAAGSGAFAGKDDQIAQYLDGGWSFYVPQTGWLAFIADEAMLAVWTGSAWVSAAASGLTALQNLALLGIGTTADATNPFAAKLNNTLWVATSIAEGGDGTLRYKLSKESSDKVLSLLFQDNFSGRAEIGLIGDDNLAFKVSPDGSEWKTALSVSKDTGVSALRALLIDRGGAAAAGLSTPSDASPVAMLIWPGISDIGASLALDTQGNAQSSLLLTNYRDGGLGTLLAFQRARGTRASPSATLNSDALGRIAWRGWDSANLFADGAQIRGIAAEDWTATARGSNIRFLTVAVGSTTLTERMRIADSGDIQMAGTATVIDANRHFRLRSYTIATLPSASPAGQLIACSNLGGGSALLESDGTNWRRVRESGHQAVTGDADFTLTTLSDAVQIRHTGTLTADRTVILSTTRAYAGARFRVTRTGGGAFNLSLGGLKNLTTNTWAEVVYDGSAWYLAACGAL